MLAAIFTWHVTPMVLFLFILGLLAFISSIYVGIKYKDMEIFICFLLASIILFFMTLLFGVSKPDKVVTDSPTIILYDQTVNVINDDTNITIEYNIKDEG